MTQQGMTRSKLLKTAGVLTGAVAVGGTVIGTAATRAETSLDAHFEMPFEPGLVVSYPEGWFVKTDIMPEVVDPQHTIVTNFDLKPLPSVDGQPNMLYVPTEAILVDIVTTRIVQGQDLSDALPLVRQMHWADFGPAAQDDTPHLLERRYRWYTAGDWSIAVMIYIGDDASDGDRQYVPAIVESVRS